MLEKTLSFELGPGLGSFAPFGLIVLQADETIEHDMRRLLPAPSPVLYTCRVPSGSEVTCQSLVQMKNAITNSARLFPEAVSFSVVGYGCTSGTSVIGAKQIKKLVSKGCMASAVTEPVSALLAACKALDVRKIGFLSPYVEEVSAALRHVLEKNGLEVSVFGTFNEVKETKVARIKPNSLANAVFELTEGTSVEAVFISCTNLQTLDIIERLEEALDVPVLSSNLVLAWHMLELSGYKGRRPDFGKLMKNTCFDTNKERVKGK